MKTVRYEFRPDVPFDEVEGALLLARVGVESLRGHAAQLDAGHLIDRAARTCVLACDAPAGEELNALFAGLLRRGLGPRAFTVRRSEGMSGAEGARSHRP